MSKKDRNIVWFLLSMLIVLAMIVPAACGKEGEEREIKNPTSFVQGVIGDVDSLDPVYAYDTGSTEQIQAIYEPLIYFDGESTTKFVKVLCTDYSVSDDGKTYRFKIREGVKFHNGDELTPEDVEYSFERGMVQDYHAGPMWMFFEPLLGLSTSRTDDGLIPLDDIKNAVEVDGDWVQFNLVEPYAPFLLVLTGTWASVVDKEWCVAQGDWDGTQESYEELNDPTPNDTPLNDITNGTGPFKLQTWDKGVQIVLGRNDEYWGKKANFETFITKVIDEWSTRKLELVNGDLDWAYVPRANSTELEGVEGLKLYRDLPQLVNDAIFFQLQTDPASPYIGSGELDGKGIPTDFFSDLDVRLAFNYCFDWDTYIMDACLGELKQMAAWSVEGLPYLNKDQEMYSLDLEKAEEHFKAAWGGQVWEKGFKVTLTYNSGNLQRKTACEILQTNVAKVNSKFQITVQAVETSVFTDEVFSGMNPIFQWGWLADWADPHNFVQPYMHSNGAWSGTCHYGSDEIDNLIAQGVKETDPKARKDIYYELQKIYHDDPPGIMLGQTLGRRYFQDWVKGFIFNPSDPANISHVYNLSKGY